VIDQVGDQVGDQVSDKGKKEINRLMVNSKSMNDLKEFVIRNS
jgi:hypothetical protein